MSAAPLELQIHASISEIDASTWDALDGARHSPFSRWAWLSALERTGCVGGETGWIPHHLTFRRAGALVAAAPAYLKWNSEGEFVFDFAWAAAAERAGIRYYPKLLVAIPFTPATGPRLLVAEGEDRAALFAELAQAIQRLVEAHSLSGAHVLFPPAEEAAFLAENGLCRRLGVQYQWHNRGYASFDEFLSGLSSKRRNQIKRERRSVREQGVTIQTLSGDALTSEIMDAMYRFYLSTIDKFTWGRRYLNRAFFEEITHSLRGSIEVVLARDRAGTPIAGALNALGEATLYGRYWGVSPGAEAAHPFLHFAVCYYHSVEDAIARKLEWFEPGAGGSHKVARGFDPTLTHSAHHIAEPRLDRAVREFLAREGAAVEAWVRSTRDERATRERP